jgi:ribosomal protein L16 Arg81 hydroxylase
MTKEHFTAEKMLAPIEVGAFLEEYWEKQTLIINDRDPNYYQALLTLEDVDSLIYYGLSGPADVKLVKGRQPPYTNHMRPNTPPTVLAQEAYVQGYTVVVNDLARRHRPITQFVRSLEGMFNCPVQVNSYLTPPNSQGFDAHYDTHDVFILQIAGSKHWFVYDAFLDKLPMGERARPVRQDELPAAPLHDFMLQAGELLYMPRGFVHYANTKDESSLHLTIGIHNTRWLDLLTQSLSALARHELALRKSVPPGYLTREGILEGMEESFRQLLEVVSQKASLSEAAALLSDKLIFDRPAAADGHFAQLDQLNQITLDTQLTRRAGLNYRLTATGKHATLQFSGNLVRGPRSVAEALQFVADTETFAVRDLPGLGDENKRILAVSLVREGLMQIA